jgi:hypothetical protein
MATSPYRKTNILMRIDGEEKCLFEWVEIAKQWGVSRQLIQDRMARGWSVEDAVFTKPRKYAARGKSEGVQ